MENRNPIDPARTAAGRSAIKKLGSPKETQRQNLLAVLVWLYHWGYSTSDILSDLLGRRNRSHARRLATDGWIRPVSIKGYPTYYVLSERGLNEAIRRSSELYEYKEIDPYRVHLPTLHHYLIAQQETIFAMSLGIYDGYRTERMYKSVGNNAPRKIPDVMFYKEVEGAFGIELSERRTAVEIELTPKWNYHLDLFVTNIVQDIQDDHIWQCVVISDSPAILERYRAAFEPGRTIKLWKKDKGGKVSDTGETLTLDEWISEHVFFRPTASLLEATCFKDSK